ncbi:MAG TPA: DUF4443 domain-containing protein [Candidatus Norongarragalinales archaeon]|nr:DUF4443 domain-containing protein [Candidatus Norongarragalinales archaeon]
MKKVNKRRALQVSMGNLGALYRHGSGRGPSPSFMEVDLPRALWILSQGEISRKALSQKLAIGEGSTRSILAHFSKNRLVRITKRGCTLTERGEAVFQYVRRTVLKVSGVRGSPITFNHPAFGIHLSPLSKKVRKGLEERDEAIRAGAEGATVLILKKGRFAFPGSEGNDFVRGEVAKELKEEFNAHDGDVLILSYSRNGLSAERGAWSAAMHLMGK